MHPAKIIVNSFFIGRSPQGKRRPAAWLPPRLIPHLAMTVFVSSRHAT
jgi:hypothetical protein